MTDPKGRGEAAILRPAAAAAHFTLARVAPWPRWAPLVEYLWIARWDLDEPYDQQVIPQPCVHVTAERWRGKPRLLVNLITREPFVRRLEGAGHVIGATFRPASFRAVLRSDLGGVAGRVVPLADLVGPDDSAVAAELLDAGGTDEQMAATLQMHLDACGAEPDPLAQEINDLVRWAEVDRSVTRADQLAERAGVSLRTLERQFTACLGIGPKWVVQRFRLLDAAEAAHTGTPDWAQLAADLGFTDQSHLIRAFTAVVGAPPARYVRQA